MLKIVKKVVKTNKAITPPRKWLDKFNLKIQNLYINEHINNQYNDRINKADFKVTLQITNEMILLVQREKNGTLIKEIKGCIKLTSGLYLIVNTYLEKTSKDVSMKGLTVLTKNQLKSSKNFAKGNHLTKKVELKVDELVYEEMYFDYSKYSDIYKDLEWDETGVTYKIR